MSLERKAVDRVSLGIATLMREPSVTERRRTLDEAYELGIRRFDVAPTYGLGAGEKDLAWLISQGAVDLRVTTKFGRRLPAGSSLLRSIQSPVRSVIRRVPAVRRLGQRFAGADGNATTGWSLNELIDAFDSSLDSLGTTSIDTYLSHEVIWDASWDEVWVPFVAELKRRGVTRVGASGPAEIQGRYPKSVLADLDVTQVPFEDTALDAPMIRRYSVLSTLSRRVPTLQADAGDLRKRWNVSALAPLSLTEVLALGVLAHLDEKPDEEIVLGTSSADHLRDLLREISTWSKHPEVRWSSVRSDLASGGRG